MRPLTLTVPAIRKSWQVTEKRTIMYLAVTKLEFPPKAWMILASVSATLAAKGLPISQGVLGHGKVVQTCAQERQSRCMNPTNRRIVP